MNSLRKYQREMLQEAKLGMAPLHLLNDMALFYPVNLAQFLTGDDNNNTSMEPSNYMAADCEKCLLLA